MPEHSVVPAQGRPGNARKRHRVGMIAFVVVGALLCLLLGYWQLSRWNSTSGTFQNLGYSFQWPFFAAFLVFAYRRFVRLEAEREAEEAAEAAGSSDDSDDAGRRAPATEIPADLLPDRRRMTPSPGQDEALRAYNDYLAELHRSDTAAHEEDRSA